MATQQIKKIVHVTYRQSIYCSYSLLKGRGTYSDYVITRGLQSLCERKLLERPELGFAEELQASKQALMNLVKNFDPEDARGPDRWISPFVTIDDFDAIMDMIVLSEKQFLTGEPTLQPGECFRLTWLEEKLADMEDGIEEYQSFC